MALMGMLGPPAPSSHFLTAMSSAAFSLMCTPLQVWGILPNPKHPTTPSQCAELKSRKQPESTLSLFKLLYLKYLLHEKKTKMLIFPTLSSCMDTLEVLLCFSLVCC